MSSLAVHLSSLLLPRVGQSASESAGFSGWIRQGNFQPALDFGLSGTLDRVELRQFVPYASHDFERFALSSRETFSVALLERQAARLAGWPLLKLYYAAFFAAHALMRALGTGVVKIDSASAQHLSQIVKLYDNEATEFRAGQYLYQTTMDVAPSGLVSISLRKITEGTGVHDSFWRIFCDFLERISENAVNIGAPDASDFVSTSLKITDAIKDGGDERGVWLSSMRNAINYQHRYTAWYPIPRSAKILDILDDATIADSDVIRLDHSKKRNPVAAFVSITRFLACLNIEIAGVVAARSNSRAFAGKWQRLEASLTAAGLQ